jgi:hypothetical protein
MKKNTSNIFLQTLILLFISVYPSYGQQPNYANSIAIKQHDSVWMTNKVIDSVHLSRNAFSIVFEGRKFDEKKRLPYATQIAAVTEDSCLSYITVAQKIDDIPFFKGGTGLAAEDTGYTNLFIDNEAHHYIYYSNEKDRRAKLLSKKGDILQLQWDITQAFYKEEDIAFDKLPLDHIYLVILNDKNLNGVVDEGETKVIKIIFSEKNTL